MPKLIKPLVLDFYCVGDRKSEYKWAKKYKCQQQPL